ncbi:MAG: hypothetical protein DHS20C18_08890 [Saprospiraceae bacterium]|nr:MAG: hypothetical protein DHS20C18_08890 [Saprospiraceae bacterium]
MGLIHREKAETWLKNNQPDSAFYHQEKALSFFQEANDLSEWINTSKFIGRIYRDQLGDYPAALKAFEGGTWKKLWRAPETEGEWETLAWNYVNISYTYAQSLGKFKIAAEYYQAAIPFFVKANQQDSPLVGEYVYRELANIYTRMADFDAAEILLLRFKSISEKNKNYGSAAEACSDLGTTYLSDGKLEKAINIYLEGLQFPNLQPEIIGIFSNNLGKTYVQLGNLFEGSRYLKKAIQIFRQEEGEKFSFHLSQSLLELNKLQRIQKNYPEALNSLREAEGLLDSIFINRQRREFSLLQIAYAQTFKASGAYTDAYRHLQLALQSVLEGFSPALQDNPAKEQLIGETVLTRILFEKAELLTRRFHENGDFCDLENALVCHDLLFEAEKLLRQSYRFESSKLSNLEESRSRSERAIEIALEAWKTSGAPQYKQKAFDFAERSKSILLLEAFQKSNAEALAGIPNELLVYEKDLQTKIDEAEKKLFNARSSGADLEVVQSLENDLLNQRQAYMSWIKDLEALYPSYYNLKYNFKTATLAEIRKELSKNEALIEYFAGEKNLYTFYISKDQFEILCTPVDFPLQDWVVSFHRNIEGYQHLSDQFQASCEEYTTLGLQLYQKLLQPLESYGLAKKLTIIPSGILAFLSFDALLTEKPANSCYFNEYPYVINRHNIHYGYSATLQNSLYKSPKNRSDFAGFAPEFSGLGGFQALRYNRNAVEVAQSVLGGQLYLGPKATIEQFKAVSEQFGIFHLATHAEANTEAGDFSFIVFANAQGGYDSLFVRDLYGLSFQAELIVLSACETALGTLYNGEGVISLARGFLHSGARSVLTTLWSIDDVANRNVMQAFYQNLQKGKSKSEALQLAKLSQIQNSDRRNAHPVYWAGFTAVGNMEAVYTKSYWMYMVSVPIILLLGFFFVRRRKQAPFAPEPRQELSKPTRKPAEVQ